MRRITSCFFVFAIQVVLLPEMLCGDESIIPSLKQLSALAVARTIADDSFMTNSKISSAVINHCFRKIPTDQIELVAQSLKKVLASHSRIVFENVRAGDIHAMLFQVQPCKLDAALYGFVNDKEEGSCWGCQLPRMFSLYKLSFIFDDGTESAKICGPWLMRPGAVVPLWQEKSMGSIVRSLVIRNLSSQQLDVQVFRHAEFLQYHGELYGDGDCKELPPDGEHRYRLIIPFLFLDNIQKKIHSLLRLKVFATCLYDAVPTNKSQFIYTLESSLLTPLCREELVVLLADGEHGIEVGLDI